MRSAARLITLTVAVINIAGPSRSQPNTDTGDDTVLTSLSSAHAALGLRF